MYLKWTKSLTTNNLKNKQTQSENLINNLIERKRVSVRPENSVP